MPGMDLALDLSLTIFHFLIIDQQLTQHPLRTSHKI